MYLEGFVWTLTISLLGSTAAAILKWGHPYKGAFGSRTYQCGVDARLPARTAAAERLSTVGQQVRWVFGTAEGRKGHDEVREPVL